MGKGTGTLVGIDGMLCRAAIRVPGNGGGNRLRRRGQAVRGVGDWPGGWDRAVVREPDTTVCGKGGRARVHRPVSAAVPAPR
jgi:hypothetical protein